MCNTQKRYDTPEGFFTTSLIPSECRWDFQGNTVPKQCSSLRVFLQRSLWVPSATYSSRLFQDSHHNIATKPPWPLCLCLIFSQQLSITAFPGLTYFSVTLFSPRSLFPPKHPFPPRFSQQQPLSPCQLGASAWIPLLTEVTGITYNYMAMDYGALFSIQILAFLKWQNIINSGFCLQWKFNSGGRPSLSFHCVWKGNQKDLWKEGNESLTNREIIPQRTPVLLRLPFLWAEGALASTVVQKRSVCRPTVLRECDKSSQKCAGSWNLLGPVSCFWTERSGIEGQRK